MEKSLTNKYNVKTGTGFQFKLRQWQYESDMWKRNLGFMTNENIHLKNRLSEILKENFDNSLLEELENFQNRFVRADELIAVLREDVAALDQLVEREIFEDGKIIREIDRSLNNIRRNITVAEKQFGKLKLDFNSYLTENL